MPPRAILVYTILKVTVSIEVTSNQVLVMLYSWNIPPPRCFGTSTIGACLIF